jgi:hypothetical protein
MEYCFHSTRLSHPQTLDHVPIIWVNRKGYGGTQKGYRGDAKTQPLTSLLQSNPLGGRRTP